ncbi:MAG: tyrosine--tRNA ligase [Candidatus Liptonbacteria bacterium]|nr:tyrosine--tRNA ligase [Candidatus Liptonbacteria bacterium]
MDKKELINEVLTRSVSYIVPSRDVLERTLLSGKKLTIYMGADPTGPHLHLGHLTNFLFLKRMQNLGHKVIFLIGDFTAMIGDPTDKSATRKPLTEKDVKENMRTFKEQVSRIISFSGKSPALIKRNSEWYEKMTLKKFMKDLLGYFNVQNMRDREYFTVQWMLQRDMFKERLKRWEESQHTEGFIGLKEFIYPILQGYDGVAMNVDMEIGGNDQVFNMAIGRALRKAHVEKKNTSPDEKFFVATTLLVNPKTGKKLMNKSEGGLINLDDSPNDIFGKVMALDDDSMFAVAEHCTLLPVNRIEGLKKINPRDAKLEIAFAVVEVIYGKTKAEEAKKNWINTFSKKEMSEAKLPELKLKSKKISVLDLVLSAKTVESKSEAHRLINQGAVAIDGQTKKDPREVVEFEGGETAKIGKKNFFRIRIKRIK